VPDVYIWHLIQETVILHAGRIIKYGRETVGAANDSVCNKGAVGGHSINTGLKAEIHLLRKKLCHAGKVGAYRVQD
jgi:hypothetical protein